VEPIGQGDSYKPADYPYSTLERADLVEALWRYHGVLRTVVVTFDSASHDTGNPRITAALTVNGGLFADAHTHPWQGTPLLRSPLGTLGAWRMQRSQRAFAASWIQARMYSNGYRPSPAELAELWSVITRRAGAAFLHDGAGFVKEHRRHALRWDLATIARALDGTVPLYVGGSAEDPYEHRQIQATRDRVPEADVLTFPGGHMTTSEHPEVLAAAIRHIARRHGVGTRAMRIADISA
jgi:pimeloyl-ACP methyl ester carboxylesterase